ncbi:hypothetical protein SAMN04488511_11413 [Pedobacter suwonensis]|uniref:Uncharacterized protein n=1 Tax=Pedobacter suwonensis TaxID=332999 RepID=A0A1I0TSK6_9SPHI|nr:hypothetical protein [Pedobacter suwonensis]SFA54794.1 hypothetical protein SAMN04488511_11413 [Pedobacter suwonensis]
MDIRPKINIDKGLRAIVNEMLACGETFSPKKVKTKPKSKKVKKDSG